MELKQKIIISLVTSLFSLVYGILNYYGLVRYFNIRVRSVDTYIKKYKKVNKLVKNKVIINMTTTPSKMKKLKPVINSLLDQSVKVDLITVTVPQTKEKLPHGMDKVVFLTKTKVDYGKLNILIPPLLTQGDKDTVIITVKDDVLYGYDYIEILLEEYKKHGGKYIIYSDAQDILNGAIFGVGFFDNNFLKNPPKNIKKWIKETNKYKYINYKENYK